ncbi:uracil phosphoribosyltransferase [Mycoplasma testudineum]|uniref:Uracil phosphoribosyltransferase n=1 Tax=Mycoplasma testudineum TaxID=244584 RepID=A0A4R6IJF5_9MOLU|nr:uracil phosphoribosyltransferase [Mycoplasma testudineum]OYD26452.1 uracil phosphoribosyltransferase [Mycoplasma testudineum]TDO22154.1 uracil phosphoribosyltransferase [Mycoplasma testudineum]
MLKMIDHSMIKQHITTLRDHNTLSAEFTQVAGRISEIMLYELLKNEPVNEIKVDTPIKKDVTGYKLSYNYIFIPIIRAGLTMIPNARRIVPDAKIMHIGIARDEVNQDYITYLDKVYKSKGNDHAIVFDPMLATGKSAAIAIKKLQNAGYKKITFIGIIGVDEGIEYLENEFGKDFEIYLAVKDPILNSKKYIEPGLGDAGDRAYGLEKDV